MKISPRLMTIANYVHRGAVVADIGTDHAYLPIYVVQEGICPRAVAGDLNPGPFKTAQEAVQEAGLADKIDVRFGNGLVILEPGEVDTLIIAGMGGGTIREILKDSPEVVAKAARMVLQPMVDGGAMRLWLAEQGWYPTDEKLVEDEGRIYEVIALERAEQPIVEDPLVIELGPKLIENKDPLFIPFLSKTLESLEAILEGLTRSKHPSAREREKEIRDKVEAMKKVIACRLNVKL